MHEISASFSCFSLLVQNLRRLSNILRNHVIARLQLLETLASRNLLSVSNSSYFCLYLVLLNYEAFWLCTNYFVRFTGSLQSSVIPSAHSNILIVTVVYRVHCFVLQWSSHRIWHTLYTERSFWRRIYPTVKLEFCLILSIKHLFPRKKENVSPLCYI